MNPTCRDYIFNPFVIPGHTRLYIPLHRRQNLLIPQKSTIVFKRFPIEPLY